MIKRNIGCIVNNIEGNYNRGLWSVIRNAAEAADCTLRVFEGRTLRYSGGESRHNAIYALAEKYRPEGWLVAGNHIGSHVTAEEYRAFCAGLARGVPLVSLGIEVPEASTILLDNGLGMRRMMEHLIRTHGYRNIAFMRGPEGHFEANERYQVYLSVMASHRIPVDPDLVVTGRFSLLGGYEAFKALHESGKPVDCVVCANDDSALGAYYFVRELRRGGVRPVTEHITGFDNSIDIRTHQPALTTVAQPLDRMVERAFRILLGAMPGEIPRERAVFPTELVVRESCGCRYLSDADTLREPFTRPPRDTRIYQAMQTYSLSDLFDELARMLPGIGIHSCFIVRYGQPIGSAPDWNVPEASDLLFAFAGGRRHPLTEGIRFPTADLLPEPFRSYPHRVTDVIKPLFFRDEQYGYVIFEAVDDDTRGLEELRGQIADSLKFALMMQLQKETESDLARLVEELQESNRRLVVTATTDPLTGLLNRGGFFEKAREYLDGTGDDGQSDLILYIDVDKLKFINRKLGYPEGDKAILAVARILSDAFSPEDLIGRFCGDEFVVLVKNASESRYGSCQDRIARALEAYRLETGSTLEVFLGHTVVMHGQDIPLERVIRQADTDLYMRKRRTPGGH